MFIFKAVLKDLGCTEYKKKFRPGYHLVPYIAKVKKKLFNTLYACLGIYTLAFGPVKVHGSC